MSWEDRLSEAAYTSPGGTRTTFDYEDVRKSIEAKGTAFNFADANGTYVQRRGHAGNQYPMRLFFSGENYDLAASAFEATLLESGTGKLEHPTYGTIDVVPFGPIGRRDDLTSAANQAVFELTFWETTGLLYPSSQDDPAASVLTALAEYNDAIAAEFTDTVSLDSTIEQATVQGKYQILLDTTQSALQSIADTQDDVRQQFDAVVDSVNAGIDTLIAQPLTLAFQTAILIQAPARALTNIQARLAAYRDLANSIIGGDGEAESSNSFHTDDLYASTYVSASVLSTVNNQFLTKTDALTAAQEVLDQMAAVTVWRDDSYAELGENDTGTAYQQLQEAVALCAGFLVEISFSLKQERRIVLDRDRTFVDLCAELYGQTDEIYDFFITSNDLSGDEYILIERGREIVYYL